MRTAPDPVKNADVASDRGTDERLAEVWLSVLTRMEETGHRRARATLQADAFEVEIIGDEARRSAPGPVSAALLVALKEMAGMPTGAVARRVRGDLVVAGGDNDDARWFRVHLDAAAQGARAVIERAPAGVPLALREWPASLEAEAALTDAERATSVDERAAALARAAERAAAFGHAALHTEALRARADLALALGERARADELLEEALAAASAAHADALSRAALLLARVDAADDDPTRALTHAEEADALVAEAFGERSLDRARIRWRVGACQLAAGARPGGLATLEDTLAVSEEAFGVSTAGDAYARVRLAGMRDEVELSRAVQDARQAAIALDEACAGLRDEVWERGHAQRTLGFLLWRAGRAPHARRALEKACQVAQRLGSPRDAAAADASDLLAVVLAEARDLDTAERALARAKKRAEALTGPARAGRDAFLAFAEGRVHEARGRREEARAAYEAASAHPALARVAMERAAAVA